MRRLATIALLALALGVPVALAATAITAAEASASVAYESPYTFEQTFGTALRLVRVDLGFKVIEKDLEHGYLLFEYTSPEGGKKATQGSLEIVAGRSSVHVVVQLPAMPQYHEQVILDALVKKLTAEHGDPPAKAAPPPPPPPPPPPSDAGADAVP
jgi:hypothetical protein